MKWLFALLLTCSTLTAQVAGVALYLQYAPPGAPPPAPLAPPVPVTNFVPNSSFELGGTRGWIIYGSGGATSYGNESSTAGRVSTNESVHGSNSMRWMTRIISCPMYLSNGNYTLTYSMKATAAITAYWTNVAHDFRIQPTVPLAITTSWTRYTNQWVAASNGYYAIKFEIITTPPNTTCFLDAMQLQRGTVATDYTPTLAVESGFDTSDIDHVLFSTDPKQFRVRFWNNTGTNTSASQYYEIRDMWNSNVLSGTVSTNALVPGHTAINVATPSGRTGWMRVWGYQPNVNDSIDELTVSVFPYAASTTVNTNGVIGGHPEWGTYGVKRDRKLGYTASRDLSPAHGMRWASVQPTAFGPFVWSGGGINNSDYEAASFSTNGTMPLIVLTPTNGDDPYWPPWAVNGSGAADINLWSNYCRQVVLRFSPPPSNCWNYEIGNEPHNIITPTDFLGGNPGTLSYDLAASNRARFMVAGAQAVRIAFPNAQIIGIAGENIASRGWSTWTNMTAPEQALFNVISAHLYPQNHGNDNPNLPAFYDDDFSRSASVIAWKQIFGSIRPLWNTESAGQGGIGGFLGPVSLASWNYVPHGFLSPEAGRNWRVADRKVVSVDRESRTVIRSLGLGFKKVFNYFSRYFDDVNMNPNESFFASNQEFNGAPKVGAVASLIAANHFIRYPGLGRVTNSAVPGFIEAYMFTNELGTVIGIWATDNYERALTTADGRFALHDAHGNLVATNQVTYRIGRTPSFLVSGALTTAQLSNAVAAATVAFVPDLTGPNVSIDVSPIGMVAIGTTNFWKWTLTDRGRQPWSIGPNFSPDHLTFTSRIKFAAADPWISMGSSNHFRHAFTAIGTNQLWVEGKDASNNVSVATGPTFISY